MMLSTVKSVHDSDIYQKHNCRWTIKIAKVSAITAKTQNKTKNKQFDGNVNSWCVPNEMQFVLLQSKIQMIQSNTSNKTEKLYSDFEHINEAVHISGTGFKVTENLFISLY